MGTPRQRSPQAARAGQPSPHRILPIALDSAALQLAPELNDVSFVRLDVRQGEERDRHLILHIAVRALRTLQDLPVCTENLNPEVVVMKSAQDGA
jgi:hypothetical protein